MSSDSSSHLRRVVLFCHPTHLGMQSMPRFSGMIFRGLTERGYSVETWAPGTRFYDLSPRLLSKWAGYVDSFVLFPLEVKRRIRKDDGQTLYVFCDQALGPWVPLVKHLPHVVHCHDLLALRSALGEIPENPTRFTGRVYQRYIRWGFEQARSFVAISPRTEEDLLRLSQVEKQRSVVVYNGLSHPYCPLAACETAKVLRETDLADAMSGVLLHVGGGAWYKNRIGVLEIYHQYASVLATEGAKPAPLWFVGPQPDSDMKDLTARLPEGATVRYLEGIENATLQALYSCAYALIFPSLAEGFGWPIAEALACGCPVLTTDERPMNDVGGNAAAYIPKRPVNSAEIWAARAAGTLRRLLSETLEEKATRKRLALLAAARFSPDVALDAYVRIYTETFRSHQRSQS